MANMRNIRARSSEARKLWTGANVRTADRITTFPTGIPLNNPDITKQAAQQILVATASTPLCSLLWVTRKPRTRAWWASRSTTLASMSRIRLQTKGRRMWRKVQRILSMWLFECMHRSEGSRLTYECRVVVVFGWSMSRSATHTSALVALTSNHSSEREGGPPPEVP